MTRTQLNTAFKDLMRSLKKAYTLKDHPKLPKLIKMMDDLGTEIDKIYGKVETVISDVDKAPVYEPAPVFTKHATDFPAVKSDGPVVTVSEPTLN